MKKKDNDINMYSASRWRESRTEARQRLFSYFVFFSFHLRVRENAKQRESKSKETIDFGALKLKEAQDITEYINSNTVTMTAFLPQ